MEINEIYDHYIADHYDEDPYDLLLHCRNLAHQQIQSALDSTDSVIVDLGAGTGQMIAELSEHYHRARFVAVDKSAKMMSVAQDKFSQLALTEVKAYVDDVMNFDKYIPACTANLVNLHFILSYIDLKRILSKSYDSLDEKGFVSIITGTYDSCPYLQSLAKGLISLDTIRESHSMPQSVSEVRATLESNRFRIVKEDIYRKQIEFDSFKALHRLAIHSSWFVNKQVLNMTEADIEHYDEMTQDFFPLRDEMEIAVLLAQKIT